MNEAIKAVYRGGALIPEDPLDLPDGTTLELLVRSSLVASPPPVAPAERARILQDVTRRMRGNPIPAAASGLTRDELHERR